MSESLLLAIEAGECAEEGIEDGEGGVFTCATGRGGANSRVVVFGEESTEEVVEKYADVVVVGVTRERFDWLTGNDWTLVEIVGLVGLVETGLVMAAGGDAGALPTPRSRLALFALLGLGLLLPIPIGLAQPLLLPARSMFTGASTATNSPLASSPSTGNVARISAALSRTDGTEDSMVDVVVARGIRCGSFASAGDR